MSCTLLTPHTGIQAESAMKSGALVPDAMILRLILNELKTRNWVTAPGGPSKLTLNSGNLATSPEPEADDFVSSPSEELQLTSTDPSTSFILDGFPRTQVQASQLDKLVPINFVVNLLVPHSVILGRIRDRWVHAPSGRVYNTSFQPPKVAGKDDVTGEPLTKRADDDEDTWVKRLRQFERTSQPLIEHYGKSGVLWEVRGKTSDEITPQLVKEFERRFC
jgi:adenylate kinase